MVTNTGRAVKGLGFVAEMYGSADAFLSACGYRHPVDLKTARCNSEFKRHRLGYDPRNHHGRFMRPYVTDFTQTELRIAAWLGHKGPSYDPRNYHAARTQL